MTIKVDRILSGDLFSDNVSILLDPEYAATTSTRLSAITFVAEKNAECDDLSGLTIACAQHARTLIYNPLCGNGTLWLFVAHESWRAATRIARHQRLWRSIPALLPLVRGDAKRSDEIEFPYEDHLRFAGMIEVPETYFVQVADFVRCYSASALIFTTLTGVEHVDCVRSLFSAAFPKRTEREQEVIDWASLALNRCPYGDLLIRISGAFDDRDAAVDIIGSLERIQDLSSPIEKAEH